MSSLLTPVSMPTSALGGQIYTHEWAGTPTFNGDIAAAVFVLQYISEDDILPVATVRHKT